MKSLLIVASMVVVVIAQRPGYLGSGPVGYPGLASRFKQDSGAQASSTTTNVENRLGESGGSTSKIPVDARGDTALVDRLNQWPREHRPFWVLNAEHIEAQRGNGAASQNQGGSQQGGGQFTVQQDPNFASRGAFDDFGNPIETQTIRPIQTRGSFAG